MAAIEGLNDSILESSERPLVVKFAHTKVMILIVLYEMYTSPTTISMRSAVPGTTPPSFLLYIDLLYFDSAMH